MGCCCEVKEKKNDKDDEGLKQRQSLPHLLQQDSERERKAKILLKQKIAQKRDPSLKVRVYYICAQISRF